MHIRPKGESPMTAQAKEPSETIQYLNKTEVAALFDAAKGNDRDEAMLRLCYQYGLRAVELRMLERDDVDFDAKRIRVHRVKGSLPGEYTLESRISRLLKRMLKERKDSNPALFVSNRGQAIAKRTIQATYNKYAKAAEIPEDKRHIHVLKHSIATHLLDAGEDIMTVKDWLGHKNIQNTLIYAQYRNGKRDEAAKRVFASDKIAS